MHPRKTAGQRLCVLAAPPVATDYGDSARDYGDRKTRLGDALTGSSERQNRL